MSWCMNSLFAAALGLDPASIPWYGKLLIYLSALVVPFLLGGYLGRKFRMPDHSWKISLCLLTFLLSGAILWLGPPLKLGIDLSGGALLVYEVDQQKKDPDKSVDMDQLITAVRRRVDPGGQKEVTIRKLGAEQLEIIVPEKESSEVDRIEGIISRAGSLEFRILANNRDSKELIERAKADPSKMQIKDSAGHLLAWWVPVTEGAEKAFRNGPAVRTREQGGKTITEVLVLQDMYDVTGQYLINATSDTDSKNGQPCVGFNFDNQGAQLFGKLTNAHLPDKQTDFAYRLGIILDGELFSAPSIQGPITNHGQITGNFTRKEVQDLVNVLNAGSLPAALTKEPISKKYIGPTLGADMIRQGSTAVLYACILVPLFMFWYYRFAGLVANIALLLNMMILFALMRLFNAAFTLTGFAGLALTVGMAVDNNILVFERLREEMDRGATLRMAIRNAFQRAGATIIDCNVTHLIAAIVLWYLGTAELKGFAVPLGIGVVTSMFTSVFVARVIFDVAEKRQWLTKAKMLRLIGHTNINFMGWFRYCLTASLLVTTIAVVMAFYRGKGLFDIDFTGGVSVQAQFNSTQDVAYVRHELEGQLPDLTISEVWSKPEERGREFVVNTSEKDMAVVKQHLADAFGDKLSHNSVDFTKPAVIPAAKDDGQPAMANPYAGGSMATLNFEDAVNHATVQQWINAALERMNVAAASVSFEVSNKDDVEGSPTPYNEWTLQTTLLAEKTNSLLANMKQHIDGNPDFPASNTIGGAVATNTRFQAIYAIIFSWVGIIVFLWVRFQGVAFGLAAVLALVHDVIVMIGAVAISIYVAPYLGFLLVDPVKINLVIIAAILTIVGYSVNDTIVVFDRIREVRGKNPLLTREMVNSSTNQTLSRTVLTTVTVFMVVIVLYCVGGEGLHGFAYALLAGVITGTYSSIYVAAPILLWLVGKQKETVRK